MQSEVVDLPHLLFRRKQKHIGARAVAKIADVILLGVTLSLLINAIWNLGAWIVFPALVLYFTAFEAHSGQTPGKRLMTIHVVNPAGSVPTIGQNHSSAISSVRSRHSAFLGSSSRLLLKKASVLVTFWHAHSLSKLVVEQAT